MDIRPFKAFRFDPAVVGDAGQCIAPPYDVIDEEQQDRLYQQNPYNVVRIDRGKEFPSDDEEENVYTRAAAYSEGLDRPGRAPAGRPGRDLRLRPGLRDGRRRLSASDASSPWASLRTSARPSGRTSRSSPSPCSTG